MLGKLSSFRVKNHRISDVSRNREKVRSFSYFQQIVAREAFDGKKIYFASGCLTINCRGICVSA